MCGRFTLTVSLKQLEDILFDRYQISDFKSALSFPRFNVAPSQLVLSVIHDGEHYRAGPLKWGFISPSSTEQSSYRHINAKAETIAYKKTFVTSLQKRRCLILADGFYEWIKENNEKKPFYFSFKDKRVFSFAGIWSRYQKEGSEPIYSCAIITTAANEDIKDVHERMPVILSKEDEYKWLHKNGSNQEVLLSLLKPYPNQNIISRRVTTLVNNPFIDNEDCLADYQI